jgi:GNAT superfamily N-acetyltransferase
MHDLSICPFRPGDQSAARRLILEGLSEHFAQINESLNHDINDIQREYVARGHLFLVAERCRELAGTGALRVEGEHVGRIVRVSVAREFRRRRVGRALVMQLVEAATALGLKRVWVVTNDDWADAIVLYLACGFEVYQCAGGSVYLERRLTA